MDELQGLENLMSMAKDEKDRGKKQRFTKCNISTMGFG